jgi:hypothetical protein
MHLCLVAGIVPNMTGAAPNKVSERLLAHAVLCRHMASKTWNEQIASELERLAEECTRAAAEAAAEAC